MEILATHDAASALPKSAIRDNYAPRCYKGTRIAVKRDIKLWGTGKGSELAVGAEIVVFWVSGAAGVGKSAIQQSIVDECHEDGSLAAGFIFSHKFCGDATPFVPTIASQLAKTIPRY